MTALKSLQKKPSVDLRGHHALCEMNYHQLMSLLPGMREGVDSWSFSAGSPESEFEISVTTLESAPYTTTLAVEQQHKYLDTPRIVVRIYHDVGMAEIVSWNQHHRWLAEYSYPNPQMYHRDEKFALNQFLGDWLNFCKRNGLKESKSAIQFT